MCPLSVILCEIRELYFPMYGIGVIFTVNRDEEKETFCIFYHLTEQKIIAFWHLTSALVLRKGRLNFDIAIITFSI